MVKQFKMAEGESIGKSNVDKKNDNNDNEIVQNGHVNEPDFSDPEDFVDPISDEELVKDILIKKPVEDTKLENIIVVDNIPKVGPERFEKLKNVLTKLFVKCGTIVNDFYPLDEKSETKGYVFVEYQNQEQAANALKLLNGHKLDKQHIFAVNLFTDIDKYLEIPNEVEEPQPQPYRDRGNLKAWLQDPDCYDQYSVIHDAGETVTVFLNTTPEPKVVMERHGWTDSAVQWSPLGTYLATFHKRGIALWGGENFIQLIKFAHEGVSFIDFSPCEKYMVTLSQYLASINDPNSIIIWDIRTGAKKRSFQADCDQLIWPVFKWSHDDKYFARISSEALSIYETPSFGLLDKKSLKIPGIRNFSWSPSRNTLAYWVAEDQNVPARVTLLEIPSRTEIRAKNLFNVADCKMHWQKCGDYLCVKVDRYMKAKKEKNEFKYSGLYYNFEIFHMREKQIPVDSVEIKEPIIAFSWEPVGTKFAIIHGDGPQNSVSFYSIKPGGTVTLAKKLEGRPANHLFWSPAGQFIVLAGLRVNHSLEFIDTTDFTTTNNNEHFMATDVEWDPTGRYVVTAVSWWANKADNAYWVWSFTGRLIRKHSMDKFCQLFWRPRPATLLSEEKIKEIRKNLNKYSAQFDIKDRMAMSKVSKELLEKRKRLLSEFTAYRKKNESLYQSQKGDRMELREGQENIDIKEIEEETVEFLVKEEVIELE